MISFARSFIKINEVANPKQIWICFHYLGGSASSFYSWKHKIPNNVQLYAAQLPGRENRKDEDFLCDMSSVVASYFQDLLTLEFTAPFIFYGHSMGALIAYELMVQLEQLANLYPHLLAISACKAPHCILPKINFDYSDTFLIQQLESYGGTPQAILQDEALLKFFLPRFRADNRLLNNYRCQQLTRLKCAVYAWGGENDHYVLTNDITKWAECTDADFYKKIFPGGHFFINTSQTELIQEIANINCF